jgi:hypothetical protein
MYIYYLVSEAQAIFLNPFTVCCEKRFVVCPFVYDKTNGSYPFANGLNGLSRLAHLRLFINSLFPKSIPKPNCAVGANQLLLHFFSVKIHSNQG